MKTNCLVIAWLLLLAGCATQKAHQKENQVTTEPAVKAITVEDALACNRKASIYKVPTKAETEAAEKAKKDKDASRTADNVAIGQVVFTKALWSFKGAVYIYHHSDVWDRKEDDKDRTAQTRLIRRREGFDLDCATPATIIDREDDGVFGLSDFIPIIGKVKASK